MAHAATMAEERAYADTATRRIAAGLADAGYPVPVAFARRMAVEGRRRGNVVVVHLVDGDCVVTAEADTGVTVLGLVGPTGLWDRFSGGPLGPPALSRDETPAIPAGMEM